MEYEPWLAAVAAGGPPRRDGGDRAAELVREVFARLREDFPDVTVQLSPDNRDLIAPIAR